MTAELPGERPAAAPSSELAALLAMVARGDDAAFATVVRAQDQQRVFQ